MFISLMQMLSELLIDEIQSINLFHQDNSLKGLLAVLQGQRLISFLVNACLNWLGWLAFVVVDSGLVFLDCGFVVVDCGLVFVDSSGVMGNLRFIVVDSRLELVDLGLVRGNFLG